MDLLIDTNIIVSNVHRESETHFETIRAVGILKARGYRCCLVPQNLYEFWAVATRPKEKNGLGLTPVKAHSIIDNIGQLGEVLRDPPDLYDVWRRLVVAYNVSGKQSHDARLVAAMTVHGITTILT